MEDTASCVDFTVAPPETQQRQYLTDYSPRDKPWDTHRSQCLDVETIYRQAPDDEFGRYAWRMAECSERLLFAWTDDAETGESKLKLKKTRFCRVRNCPVCQWRRSLMWQARFLQSLPSLLEEYKSARWLFLTLTVRNCEIDNLRETLTGMNKSWHRLVKRPEFKHVMGWVRTTEVTRGKDDTAHPHFHALLMVPPSFFTHYYITHARWMSLWQECMKIDYEPVVHIKTVKKASNKHKQQNAENLSPEMDMLRAGLAEVLKYSTKPSDMIKNSEWFLELTRQTFRARFIATGGVLKNILRVEHESDKDMTLIRQDDEADSDAAEMLKFGFKRDARRYTKT